MEKIVLIFAAVAISCAHGISFQNDMSRISGGNLASPTQFPFMVSIQQMSALPNQVSAHRCGGAMISLQHGVTAAQCTYYLSNRTMVPITATQYRVYGGDVLLSGDNVAERTRTMANYSMHTQHIIAPAVLHDIAVFTLITPFLNTTVTPIPLPSMNFIPDDFTLCSLSGWGSTDQANNATNALRYAAKFTYNHSLCTRLYNSFVYSANIHPSMMCAASYDIYSVGCYGDLGNPLVCNGELVGILSVTNVCQVTSYPEVYTRVSNYTAWIRSETGGAFSFKPELGLFALAAIILAKMYS